MTRRIAILLIMSFALSSACGVGVTDRRGEERFARDRDAIINRLLPEEGYLSRRKLDTIIAAITTVSRVPNRDIPEDALGVRRVLAKRSLRDLREIEAIVLEAEKKWEDSRSE